MKTAVKCMAAAYAGGAVVWLVSAVNAGIKNRADFTSSELYVALAVTSAIWPGSVFCAVEDLD